MDANDAQPFSNTNNRKVLAQFTAACCASFMTTTERLSFVEEKLLPMDTQFQRDFFYQLCTLLPTSSAELTLDTNGRLKVLNPSAAAARRGFDGARTNAFPFSNVSTHPSQLHGLSQPVINAYRSAYFSLVPAHQTAALVPSGEGLASFAANPAFNEAPGRNQQLAELAHQEMQEPTPIQNSTMNTWDRRTSCQYPGTSRTLDAREEFSEPLNYLAGFDTPSLPLLSSAAPADIATSQVEIDFDAWLMPSFPLTSTASAGLSPDAPIVIDSDGE